MKTTQLKSHLKSQLKMMVAGACVFGFCGYFGALAAQNKEALRTYTTKGTVTSAQGGKLVIKDKFGQVWEYNLGKEAAPANGKNVKVTYAMTALKVEPE